jgi:serine/threonine protein phosphatase 1
LKFFGRKSGAALPVDLRIYAIGDIHGRSDLLDRLLGSIRRDISRWRGNVLLIFVGDYVDRGPDTRGVIDILIDLATVADARFLRGNHDQALLDFLGAASTFPAWREFGAQETLRSYGVPPPSSEDPKALFETRTRFEAALPQTHQSFLRNTQFSFEIGDYFFCHAGVKPGIALNLQSPRDLMWIRDEFLHCEQPFGKIVVHGHTPSKRPVRTHIRIGIDTEAYASSRLTAAVLQDNACRFLHT